MPFKNIIEKAKGLEHETISRFIKPEDQPIGETTKDKMLWAGLGAISGLAFSALVPKMFKITPTRRELIGAFLGGGLTGYTAPTLGNLILKEKQGKVPKGTAAEIHKDIEQIKEDVQYAAEAIPQFNKQSGLLSTTARIAGRAAKGAVGATWKGLIQNPWSRKARLGEKVWGLTAKAGVGTGLFAGGRALTKRRQLSSQNYITALRNNLLAGNIKPENLSQADLVAVQRLGTR